MFASAFLYYFSLLIWDTATLDVVSYYRNHSVCFIQVQTCSRVVFVVSHLLSVSMWVSVLSFTHSFIPRGILCNLMPVQKHARIWIVLCRNVNIITRIAERLYISSFFARVTHGSCLTWQRNNDRDTGNWYVLIHLEQKVCLTNKRVKQEAWEVAVVFYLMMYTEAILSVS